MKFLIYLAIIYLEVITMIHRVSKRIANFLLNHNLIDTGEFEIYVYGYEMLILSLTDLLITIILGVIFHKLSSMLIFFLMFVSVRIYSGGYHANTVTKCKVIFTLICLSVVLLSEIKFDFLLNIIIMTIYIVSCIFMAPVESYNKPLSPEDKQSYRKISIFFSILWCIISFVTYFSKLSICRTVTVTALIVTILMIVGEYGKEGNHEKS